MILSTYIARRFLWAYAQVLGAFWAIMMLIDMVEQLRRFSGQGIGTWGALHLAAMNTPASLYRILPLITILAAITLFLSLARSSELVVIRAAGRSALRFLVAPVLMALAIGAVTVAVFNPLVAATQKEYDRLWAAAAEGASSTLSLADSGLWLRQGTEDGQTVIRALRANADGTELFGVTFILFGADGLAAQRVEAESARLIPGAWALTGAKRWDMAGANPEREAQILPADATLSSNLTAARIRDSFGEPSAVPFWGLPAYIAGLERAGFSARAHRVWYQMELAQPLLFAAMVLIAAGFTMRHARFGRTGVLVLMAVLGGFFIFFLRNFAQVLGSNGQIPILLSAWAAPVAAILLALGLLLHLEEG
ncbi:LPS export ABC transporter permease LptG [Pseudorhodobacter sp. MZDSW-24AT]|uniref:LPS export ABC transporter permease LptG n=1 Tax=Pseudorhodobacter sp. MZDSW-24AT TaxID=2052957 RepID=UPI000C1E3B7D|nr:LPS export ABC transporter permease LptG [Pseudorhodobacter sp. MZDSW-24AT]PJF10973.1 LPS export ABC transporter permease LptG [Pseudorhodobacter sp. MZDSW-24AT]